MHVRNIPRTEQPTCCGMSAWHMHGSTTPGSRREAPMGFRRFSGARIYCPLHTLYVCRLCVVAPLLHTYCRQQREEFAPSGDGMRQHLCPCNVRLEVDPASALVMASCKRTGAPRAVVWAIRQPSVPFLSAVNTSVATYVYHVSKPMNVG